MILDAFLILNDNYELITVFKMYAPYIYTSKLYSLKAMAFKIRISGR